MVTASATRQDVPEFADGVGTVQAYNSVLIRSRVDGALMQVPVKEGQEVKQGDLIAVIDPRPYQAALDAAAAKKTQDEATLANARRDLARYASLAKQSFASQQQLDTQQATVAQQTAAVQADQAAIETAQLNLAYCYITSPIPGRVGLRLVDPGNLVHATDSTGIVSVTQDHPIAAVFTLPQEDLPAIAEAMADGAPPRVLAFSSDGKRQLDTGTLLAPNNQVDASTGTIQLKAEFPNAKNTLWPGQFVDAHLQVATARDAVTVPPAAIQHGPDGLYVYVVKNDGTAALQPVAVGYQTASLAVVTKGLNGGETVVIDGAMRLQPGTRVTQASRVAS
ncbi:MAG: efflux RND transporter periplasmic adaptor subunit [Acetobacteraceae bacterium]|nr:efflux RND transporter periplasmic adaptor subunit [Acetobacteraceae bacterium]